MNNNASADLQYLAAAAGLQRNRRDVAGRDQLVADDDLAAILEALGYKTGSAHQRRAALAQVGKSPARFAIAPLEDLPGETEQPILPGPPPNMPTGKAASPRSEGEAVK